MNEQSKVSTTVKELREQLHFNIAMARIPLSDLEQEFRRNIKILRSIANNEPRSAAAANALADILENTYNDLSNVRNVNGIVGYTLALKELVAWSGQVQLGWL